MENLSVQNHFKLIKYDQVCGILKVLLVNISCHVPKSNRIYVETDLRIECKLFLLLCNSDRYLICNEITPFKYVTLQTMSVSIRKKESQNLYCGHMHINHRIQTQYTYNAR